MKCIERFLDRLTKPSILYVCMCRIDDLMEDVEQPLVCEFAGLPASGKTQLAHWASLHTLASNRSATVVYVDSGSHFSPKRIKNFWSHSSFSSLRQSGVVSIHLLCFIVTDCDICPTTIVLEGCTATTCRAFRL